jgi:hypothetical protein
VERKTVRLGLTRISLFSSLAAEQIGGSEGIQPSLLLDLLSNDFCSKDTLTGRFLQPK